MNKLNCLDTISITQALLQEGVKFSMNWLSTEDLVFTLGDNSQDLNIHAGDPSMLANNAGFIIQHPRYQLIINPSLEIMEVGNQSYAGANLLRYLVNESLHHLREGEVPAKAFPDVFN